jgi:hypothetical protein
VARRELFFRSRHNYIKAFGKAVDYLHMNFGGFRWSAVNNLFLTSGDLGAEELRAAGRFLTNLIIIRLSTEWPSYLMVATIINGGKRSHHS